MAPPLLGASTAAGARAAAPCILSTSSPMRRGRGPRESTPAGSFCLRLGASLCLLLREMDRASKQPRDGCRPVQLCPTVKLQHLLVFPTTMAELHLRRPHPGHHGKKGSTNPSCTRADTSTTAGISVWG